MKPSYALSLSLASRSVGVGPGRPAKARAYASVTTLATLMILAGCGGAGSSHASSGSRKARATLRVLWPERNARLVPNAANSLVVQLSKGGSVVDTKTIARPASGQNQTQTEFAGLEEAAYDVAIKAYPNADGSGVAQASGAGVLNAKTDGSGTVTVSLASTVSTVVVTPAAPSATVGGTTTLTASAKDAQGNIVLLSAGGGTESVVWSSDAPGVATVAGTGLTATLTGVAAGTANVKATLTTDDAGTLKSGSAPVTVTATTTAVGLVGQIAWNRNTVYNSDTQPIVGQDGSVYTGFQGALHGYDAGGNPTWSFSSGDHPPFPLGFSTDGNTIYMGAMSQQSMDSTDTTLFALDTDGNEKWSLPLGEDLIATRSALSSTGVIYFGTQTGKLMAVDPDGNVKWAIPLEGGGSASMTPVVAPDGTIYTGNTSGRVFAVSPNGTIKWSRVVGGYLYVTPAVGPDGSLYVGGGSNLLAFDANGTPKWTCPMGGTVYGGPALGADGTLYSSCGDDKIYAIDAGGQVKWTAPVSYQVTADLMIDKSGAVCALTRDGYAYGIKPDGTQKWRLYLGAGHESEPTMGPDGRIYVNLSGCHLVAIR